MVEGARLESVFRGNSNGGSNPLPSAKVNKSSEKATFSFVFNGLRRFDWSSNKKRIFCPTIEPKMR